MINTYNLFAVPVTHCKMPIPINLHKKIVLYVEKNYKKDDIVSCKNGFQFHGTFDGKEELLKILNLYLNNTLKLKIVHVWLNVLGYKSYNTPHNHIGINISHSGVFYLSHENNNIHFFRDQAIFEIKPKLFDFLIFPHNLLHYVLPEERNEKRICFAFNLNQTNEGE